MSPKRRGRPTPSTVRFAHRSTRGKPAQPSSLDAPRAPAGPPVVALHDLTRFPAPAAWGAGATPPTASPPAWGPAATRRRSATCRRLPCGSPRLPAARLGRTHLQWLRAAVPWPHAMSFGPVVAPLCLSAVAQRLRAYGLPQPWPGLLPDRARCRGLAAATAGLGAGEAPSAARVRRPLIWRPSPSPPRLQGPLAPCALLHPVPSGCGFGSALAVWSAGLGVDFAKGDELRKYGGKQMLPSTPSRNGLMGLRI